MGRAQFFVSYVGELTGGDRAALQRPDWTLYADGSGSRQIVSVPAGSADEAQELVVAALGWQPEGITVTAGRSSLMS